MQAAQDHEGLILPDKYADNTQQEVKLVNSRGRRLEPQRGTEFSDILKGLLAGAIGGLAGTAVKSIAEQIAPPRPPERPSPPVVAVEMATGEHIPEDKKDLVQEAVHWPFGTLTGAAYGAVAEILPVATTGYGAAFGLSVLAGTHESVMPALGITPPPTELPAKEQASEVFSHTLYGVTTELVRRTVRELL